MAAMATKTWVELTLLAVLLAGAWIAFGRVSPAPVAPDSSLRRQEAVSDDPVGAGLSARTRALHLYLSAPPPSSGIGRNPFSFAERPRPAAAQRAARADDPPPPPAPPPLSLSGIAEDAGASGPVRTAVLNAAGVVLFVKEGDRVLSRFVVERIASDAVQLKDLQRGEVFTLVLK
jgi:hypothetical protein